MILRITNDKSITPGFILSLIRNIKKEIIINLNDLSLIETWNNYINQEDIHDKLFLSNKQYDIKSLILELSDTLIYQTFPNYYIIEFNNLKKLPDCKLYCNDFVQFIDSGNLELEGLQIFSKSFKKISDNFNFYKSRYFMFHL